MIYKTAIRPGVQRSRSAGEQPRLTKSLDALYHNRRVIVRFIDGTSIEGVVTKYTAYWLEVKLNDGRVVYVNKGTIKMIEVVEREEESNKVGASGNDHNKVKQK
ncbi:MAG: hypothetical protein RQ842_04365 [Vulcanisaeta sp.]|nr:hypothetical protein [Vulcanisaeta sp.]